MATKAQNNALTQWLEKEWNPSFGAGTLRTGKDIARPYEVISTGSILLDLATTIGGYPEGKIIQICGNPDVGKTTLCFMAMAQAQAKYPNRAVGYIDVEHKYDSPYARSWGVDESRLALFQPEVAEDAADSLTKFLRSKLFSMIVIDSVGAMIGRVETEKTADEATVAIVARIVTRMVGLSTALAARNGIPLLVVNQYRSNISKYGGPTSLPGGWKLRYGNFMNLTLKTTGQSPLEDNIKGDKIPVGRQISINVDRNKGGPAGKVAMVMFHTVASKYGPVGVDIADEAANVGVKLGLIQQSGSWYTLNSTGERFQGLTKVVEWLKANPKDLTELRQALIDLRAEEVVVTEEPEPVEVELEAPSGITEADLVPTLEYLDGD